MWVVGCGLWVAWYWGWGGSPAASYFILSQLVFSHMNYSYVGHTRVLLFCLRYYVPPFLVLFVSDNFFGAFLSLYQLILSQIFPIRLQCIPYLTFLS